MSGGVETKPRIWTQAELEALPEDGFIHEVSQLPDPARPEKTSLC
jgi:hypothetical protein